MVRSVRILDVGRRDAELNVEAAVGTGLLGQLTLQLSLLWLRVRLGGAGSPGRATALSVAERSVLRRVGSMGRPQPFLLSGRCRQKVVRNQPGSWTRAQVREGGGGVA